MVNKNLGHAFSEIPRYIPARNLSIDQSLISVEMIYHTKPLHDWSHSSQITTIPEIAFHILVLLRYSRNVPDQEAWPQEHSSLPLLDTGLQGINKGIDWLTRTAHLLYGDGWPFAMGGHARQYVPSGVVTFAFPPLCCSFPFFSLAVAVVVVQAHCRCRCSCSFTFFSPTTVALLQCVCA